MPHDLNQFPGHLIRRLNQQSTAVFQQRMKAIGHDLTPVQFSALSRLDKTPGIDQATLAYDIAYDRATIGGVVKRLVQKQLVRRDPNKNDRRAFNLHLTPSGSALVKNVERVVVDLQTEILTHLTQNEQRNLKQLLTKALALDDTARL